MPNILPVVWQSRRHDSFDPCHFTFRHIDRYLVWQATVPSLYWLKVKKMSRQRILTWTRIISRWRRKIKHKIQKNFTSPVGQQIVEQETRKQITRWALGTRGLRGDLIKKGPIGTVCIHYWFILSNGKQEYIVKSDLLSRRAGGFEMSTAMFEG